MATVPLGKGRYQNRNQTKQQLNGASNSNLAQWGTTIRNTIPKMNQLDNHSSNLFVWLNEQQPQMPIVLFLLLITALVIVKPIANIAKSAENWINTLCNCLFELSKQLQCERAMDFKLNPMAPHELQWCKTRQAPTSINPKTGKKDDDTIDDNKHNDNDNWFEPIVTWPSAFKPQTPASAPIEIGKRAREQSATLHTSHKQQQWLNAIRATNTQKLLFEKEKEETNERRAKQAAKQHDNNRKRSRQLIDDESILAALSQLKEELTDEEREEQQAAMALAEAINVFRKERKKAGHWNQSYVLAKTFANKGKGGPAKQYVIEGADQ